MAFYCWRGVAHSRYPLPLLYLWLLLFLSAHARLFAQGSPGLELPQKAEFFGGNKMTVKSRIGSRPPLCERRCRDCGHCEPVQVPAVPQARVAAGRFPAGLGVRGDDGSSNYKPVSWKCKCGNHILNP